MKQILTQTQKNEKEDEEVNVHPLHIQNVRAYFKKLRLRLMAALFFGFFISHILLSLYFHFQFNSFFKRDEKYKLVDIAEEQKEIIELFLHDKLARLLSFFYNKDFINPPDSCALDDFLRDLTREDQSFKDLELINDKGLQLGYAGPFSSLRKKNYEKEFWFKDLKENPELYQLGDIWLDPKTGSSYFTVNVPQKIAGNFYLLRSVISFESLVRYFSDLNQHKEIFSVLVHKNSYYQLSGFDNENLLFSPKGRLSCKKSIDALKKEYSEAPALLAYTRLNPSWSLLLNQTYLIAQTETAKMRQIFIMGLAFFVLITAFVICSIVRYLVNKAQRIAEKGLVFQNQLLHSSKLAAIGELSTGIAHEINNPLAIIVATTGVVRDMLNPAFCPVLNTDNVRSELAQIDLAAFRAQNIASQLLDLGRKYQPLMLLSNVHDILDDILDGLKKREFENRDISIVRQYAEDIPEILLDPDAMRQVFLNLINNAGDAISSSGRIDVITCLEDRKVKITIRDSGEGIDEEHIKCIFDPFFTTKNPGRGTGLGLNVSYNIVKLMGGHIEVASVKGVGSSFMVFLPIRKSGDKNNGRSYKNRFKNTFNRR